MYYGVEKKGGKSWRLQREEERKKNGRVKDRETRNLRERKDMGINKVDILMGVDDMK